MENAPQTPPLRKSLSYAFIRSALDLMRMKAVNYNYNYNRDRTATFSVVILIVTGLAALMILSLKLLYLM